MAEQGITRHPGDAAARLGASTGVREVRRVSSILASAVLLALAYGAVSLLGATSARPAPTLHWSVGDATQSVLAVGCLIALAGVGAFATTRSRCRVAGWLILGAWLALTCCLGWAAVMASSAGTSGGQDAAARASHLAAALAIALAAVAPHALVAGGLRDRRPVAAMLCCAAGLVAVAASYLSGPGAGATTGAVTRRYADPFGLGDLMQATGPHSHLAGLGCLGTALLLGCLVQGTVSALRALRTWRGPAGEPVLLLVALTLVGGAVASAALVLLADWWSDGRRIAAVYAGALVTLGVGAAVWHARVRLTAVADRLGGSATAAAVRRLVGSWAVGSSRLAERARTACLDRLAPGTDEREPGTPRCTCGQYRSPYHPSPDGIPLVISVVDDTSDKT
jgi:hypothetical protein